MDNLLRQMIDLLEDDLDHPELWRTLKNHSGEFSALESVLRSIESLDQIEPLSQLKSLRLTILYIVIKAVQGQIEWARASITKLQLKHSQNLQVNGVAFFIESLFDPENPKYQLENRFCENPFNRIEVLDNSTHQCCASWLPTNCGNMATSNWYDIWNSTTAQSVRKSVLDGSFRHCNKMLCPRIKGGLLPKKDAGTLKPQYRKILEQKEITIATPPEVINLAYDRTCNLSCPSCRTAVYAADSKTRSALQDMQERNVLPMLRHARTAYVTGSGDPFARKNFRHLLQQLSPDTHPQLKLVLMTNGLLLTPKEWEKFKNLRGMVESIRVSIDGVSHETHDHIRRGSDWEIVHKNLKFIGELRKSGAFDSYVICFVVQNGNYHEMGDAVDVAKEVGADQIFFDRMSNWGTFSDNDYKNLCVSSSTHPKFDDFMQHLRDDRLADPIAFKPSFSDLLAH
jgi:organic radical activating enzyme